MRLSRLLISTFLLSLLIVTSEAETMQSLFEALARPKTVRIEFKETRHPPLLDEPLVSAGVIRFVRGRGVIFSYITPEPSTTVYRSNQVRGGSPNRTRSRDSARPLPEFISDIFEGDIEGLQKSFEPDWETEGDSWKLILIPKSDWLKKHLRSISLRGRDQSIAIIDLDFADGERHRIEVLSTQLDTGFSPDEIKALK